MTADRVQSVDRVFSILEELTDGGGALSLSELAQRTGLPAPTIHRLLRSLVASGYVRQESSKRYALGPRLIRLGESATRMLGAWAIPHLSEVVARSGETSNMAMLEGDACVYVAQVPSPQSMRMFTEVGRVVMLHCTGVGKAILSTLPDREVVAILRRAGMPARTEHTITSPEGMLDALQVVRDQGYAMDDGEQELGVRCVAVPLPDLPIRGAISVSGPSSRVSEADVERIAPYLRSVAADIARAFDISRLSPAS